MNRVAIVTGGAKPDSIGFAVAKGLRREGCEVVVADLYEQGTDWATDLAVLVAPEDPYAWDARTVADAAFGRYLRGASDFAGGRRLPVD